jgi:LacI family transcriptional regulator
MLSVQKRSSPMDASQMPSLTTANPRIPRGHAIEKTRGRVTDRPVNRRRIMLAMEWLDYELNMGIAEYARAAGWIIDDVASHTGSPAATWRGDGIIALLRHRDSELTRFVLAANVPVVDLVSELPQLHIPRVLADNHAIGRTAAEHLISCGLHHLAFLNVWDSRVEQERMEGFRLAAESAGHVFHPIEFHGGQARQGRIDDSQGMLNWLRDRLLELPKPLGAMGQHDREAIYIIQACELAALRIPEQVAVVGSDNDPLLCELGPVPLSSVDNRRRDQGFRAAALLDELISGRPAPREPIRVPTGPVMVRYSSEVLAVPDPDLSKALRYIAENYHRPSISVEEVVRHVDITRRRLYSLFEEHLGRPIHSEILRRRLDLAKRLLLTTREKLYFIGRSCGFRGAQQLTRVFTREVGVPPSQYRQRQTQSDEQS